MSVQTPWWERGLGGNAQPPFSNSFEVMMVNFNAAGEFVSPGKPGSQEAPVVLLSPENCGCSQVACNIINNTFLSLDGFEALRDQMDGTEYRAAHFAAALARIVDRELNASSGSTAGN